MRVTHGTKHATQANLFKLENEKRYKPKGAGTPDNYPLYTALTTFYSDYFVGGLWAHLTTINKRVFLYFAYLQG